MSADTIRHLRNALEPFANLVDQAELDGEPLYERGDCIIIMLCNGGNVGNIDLADLHAAYRALKNTDPS